MIIPGNTHESKVVPCQLTSGKPSTFPSKAVETSAYGGQRGDAAAVRAARRAEGVAACSHAARSLSFYSYYLLTFDLNGAALLKFKRNKYLPT